MATKKTTKKVATKLLTAKQVSTLKADLRKNIVKYTRYIDSPTVSSSDKVWLRRVRKELIAANNILGNSSAAADYYRK